MFSGRLDVPAQSDASRAPGGDRPRRAHASPTRHPVDLHARRRRDQVTRVTHRDERIAVDTCGPMLIVVPRRSISTAQADAHSKADDRV
jgi:hypothetical protein